MREEEHNIQCACVRWFAYQYNEFRGLLFAVPNGGGRGKAQAGKLKAEGVVAGVSDLIFLLPRQGYHALCIEMKTEEKSSRQQPTQKTWQEAVEKQGYKYVVCRSFDQFVEIIEGYVNA